METQEFYQKAKEIFYHAIDLPPKERSKYISKACQNDPELIDEVESLLSAEDNDEEFFEAIQKQLVLQAASSFLRKSSDIIGSKLRNRYLVIRQLSQEPLEHFYLAEDQENSNQQVLVKIFPKSSYSSENLNENDFFKEATVLATIKHPQINQLLNFGKHTTGDIFLITENLTSSNLRSQINKNLTNNLALAANIISQLGEIISFIHNQGICHGNLKPENIVLLQEKDGSQKALVTNFGFAALKAFSEEITQTVSPKNCDYLAPEQLINKTSKASDIFTLGLIIYEILTGENPISLKTTASVSLIEYAHLREQQKIVPPSNLNPLIPKQASEQVMQSLAYNSKLRPSQAKKFCQDLASTLSTLKLGPKAPPEKLTPSESPKETSLETSLAIQPKQDEKQLLEGINLKNPSRETESSKTNPALPKESSTNTKTSHSLEKNFGLKIIVSLAALFLIILFIIIKFLLS